MGVWQLDISCTSSLSSSLTNTYLVKHQKIGSKLINSWEYHHFSFPNQHVHDSSIHHFEVFVLSNPGRKCTGFIQGKLSYQPIHVTALANLTYENCWALWTCSFEENYTNSLKNTLWLKWGLFNTKWKHLPFYMATRIEVWQNNPPLKLHSDNLCTAAEQWFSLSMLLNDYHGYALLLYWRSVLVHRLSYFVICSLRKISMLCHPHITVDQPMDSACRKWRSWKQFPARYRLLSSLFWSPLVQLYSTLVSCSYVPCSYLKLAPFSCVLMCNCVQFGHSVLVSFDATVFNFSFLFFGATVLYWQHILSSSVQLWDPALMSFRATVFKFSILFLHPSEQLFSIVASCPLVLQCKCIKLWYSELNVLCCSCTELWHHVLTSLSAIKCTICASCHNALWCSCIHTCNISYSNILRCKCTQLLNPVHTLSGTTALNFSIWFFCSLASCS